MPPPIPVAIPVATVVDTVSDSWKRTFWTALLSIVNSVMTIAIWIAIWKDLKDQLMLLSEGNESIHEKVKSCDSKIEATRADVRDIRKLLQSNIDDSASSAMAAANSLRMKISELRRESESLKDQLNEMRDKISGEQRVATVAESAAASLPSPSDNEELHGENGSRKDLSKGKIQESITKEQQEVEVPTSSTSTIGFDDVSTTTGVAYIPNGYHGLEWENVFVMHRSFRPGTGYESGIVSGNYVACIGYRSGLATITSATPFSVAGFYATAARRKNLNILVEGFDDSGNRIDSYQTTLGEPRGDPTFIDLRRQGNFEDLHKLKVTPSGGTDAGLNYDIPHVAIDDLMVY